jgi:hypothetical protein
MEQVAGALQRGAEGGRIGEVAMDRLAIQAFEIAALAGRADQRPDVKAARQQRARHGGTEEARSAGDQDGVARPQEGCCHVCRRDGAADRGAAASMGGCAW